MACCQPRHYSHSCLLMVLLMVNKLLYAYASHFSITYRCSSVLERVGGATLHLLFCCKCSKYCPKSEAWTEAEFRGRLRPIEAAQTRLRMLFSLSDPFRQFSELSYVRGLERWSSPRSFICTWFHRLTPKIDETDHLRRIGELSEAAICRYLAEPEAA